MRKEKKAENAGLANLNSLKVENILQYEGEEGCSRVRRTKRSFESEYVRNWTV